MKKIFLLILAAICINIINKDISHSINITPGDWISPGELTQSHQKISGIKECVKCHTLGKGITDSACLTCHEKLVARIDAGKGFHASRDKKCVECHTDHKGSDFNIMQFDKDAFDHGKTEYTLQDKHKQECNKCHKNEKTYLGLQTGCAVSCHNDVHKKTLSDDCSKCHNFKEWKNLKFDHDKNAKFQLTGKHIDIKCDKCHPRGAPVETAGGPGKSYEVLEFSLQNYGKCDDCHADVHKGKLKEKTCSRCHQTDGWEKKSFEHNDPKLTDYKLTGKHENVACENCHPKETIKVESGGKLVDRDVRKLKAIKTDTCADCHFDVHKEQFKDRKCGTCHTVQQAWKETTFKHEDKQYKGYKLKGNHAKVECKKCHVQKEIQFTEFKKKKKASPGTFKGIKSDNCSDCHFDVHKEQFKDTKCDACHTEKNKWKEYTFKHDEKEYKGFKLEGKHAKVECQKCHEQSEIKYVEFSEKKKASPGRFRGLKSDNCSDCHYDVHKEEFKDRKCDTCHTVQNEWKQYTFRHEDEQYKGFKLEGKHKEARCDQCHTGSEFSYKEFGKEKKACPGQFINIKADNCNNCHYDVHKGQFTERKCETCHTVENEWKKYTFSHDDKEYKGFKLEGKHAKVECEKCHAKSEIKYVEFNTQKKTSLGTFKGVKSDRCNDCHKDEHKGKYEQACDRCHTPATWKPKEFLHDPISFELEGAHKVADCEKCHLSANNYTGLDSDCGTCHRDKHKNQFDQPCTDCHKQVAWIPVEFRHDDVDFSLSGTHKILNCNDCHFGGNYRNASPDCFICHQDDYQSEPDHQLFNLVNDCTECHSSSITWVEVGYSHSSFSFSGAHSALKNECSTCHKSSSVLSGASDSSCYTCHSVSGVASSAYERVSSPSHTALNFSTTCTDCHSQSTWSGARYNHQGFSMRGIHGSLSCSVCHQSGYPGQYAGTAADDCYTCHADDHAQQHPSFPQDCLQCHSESTFGNATVSHSTFDLRGPHASLDCTACHASGYPGQYAGTSEDDCYACHASLHANQHPSYPTDCTQCHSSSTWTGASPHQTFSLIGIHQTLSCTACHATGYPGQYAGTSEDDCYACHASLHANQHPSYSTDCTQCHSTSAWLPASFSHQLFVLQGVHASLSCTACHASGYPGQYAGTSEDDCYACHASLHANQHPSYPTDCTQCHSTSAWLPASFSHQLFVLQGVHASLSCTACHASGYPGQYAGTSEDDCYACHASLHANQHPSYPTDCTQCHSTTTWVGATAPHQNFTLIGIHQTLSCTACHASGYPGQYAGVTEDDCYTCHASLHANQHPSYPTDCTQCHSTTTWVGATAPHQTFSLIGIHQTLSCTACHATGYPGQYAGVTEDDCYTCHASQHASRHPSYPTDCTQCHSTNAWLPASFSHTSFAFIGVHGSLSCNECHETGYPGVYAGTTEEDCYTCHADRYNSKHSTCPHECLLCHNASNWGHPNGDLRRELGCR